MNIAYDAMMFAREVHKDQKRKYTNQPYTDHLAEVAGIAMSVGPYFEDVFSDEFMSVCWLHDVVEDCNVSLKTLGRIFTSAIQEGVMWLSDIEEGNRATRKHLSRERLARAPGWVQTIKCADLISNTSSIVQHDPQFAKLYLEEKRLLLEVLTKADTRLRALAWEMCK